MRGAALVLLAAGATAQAADAERGRTIVESRSQGLCVLCHALPGVRPELAGTLGPPLHGVGARLAFDELRERLVAPERVNPQTVMPSYSRRDGLQRVAAARRGQPLLDSAQIDDVAAYLATLK